MKLQDVVEIVAGLANTGVTVWVDGGWCVDALVGRHVREHDDLDIAVSHSDEPAMLGWLTARGFIKVPSQDESAWNYVLADDLARRVDVHVFEFDEHGNPAYGVPYPRESLTGQATLGGITVHCVPPDWLFRFKTEYAPRPKDLIDVRALADAYGFDVPATHRAEL